MTSTAPDDTKPSRKLWSMANAAWSLDMTRQKLYDLVGAGVISTVSIGRRRYVTDAELERFVAQLGNPPPASER